MLLRQATCFLVTSKNVPLNAAGMLLRQANLLPSDLQKCYLVQLECYLDRDPKPWPSSIFSITQSPLLIGKGSSEECLQHLLHQFVPFGPGPLQASPHTKTAACPGGPLRCSSLTNHCSTWLHATAGNGSSPSHSAPPCPFQSAYSGKLFGAMQPKGSQV